MCFVGFLSDEATVDFVQVGQDERKEIRFGEYDKMRREKNGKVLRAQ